jgi:hypothetical protein
MTNERPEMHEELLHASDVRSWEDLRSTGLLWLINTTALHPRGFALGLIRRDGEIVGWKLLGDGSEPWKFNGVEEGSCDDAFNAVTELLGPQRALLLSPKG